MMKLRNFEISKNSFIHFIFSSKEQAIHYFMNAKVWLAVARTRALPVASDWLIAKSGARQS